MYSGNFDYDIIIVGAGISGLAAAHAIREKDSNISFLVLEGNDRIGGRVHSTLLKAGKNRVLPFDTGGQFICEQQIHLMQLLRKLNIVTEENVNDYGFTLGDFNEGQFYKTDSMPPIFGETIHAEDIIQFLGKNTAPEICDKIAAAIGITNIKTNTAVEAIQRNEFYVLVRTAESEYKCQYVILAVAPEHMMNILFYPPLTDAKITLYRRMHYKECVKYVITYREVPFL
ncbi:amine oxidase [Holotrichia oblita]|uniref:Amine oxidase n=1 Tax=Holotrichia oblita TaxID=644536 RepID=A0ACB9SM11_HOLOL|nr:amine oxidase [Holotrichia oblita]